MEKTLSIPKLSTIEPESKKEQVENKYCKNCGIKIRESRKDNIAKKGFCSAVCFGEYKEIQKFYDNYGELPKPKNRERKSQGWTKQNRNKDYQYKEEIITKEAKKTFIEYICEELLDIKKEKEEVLNNKLWKKRVKEKMKGLCLTTEWNKERKEEYRETMLNCLNDRLQNILYHIHQIKNVSYKDIPESIRNETINQFINTENKNLEIEIKIEEYKQKLITQKNKKQRLIKEFRENNEKRDIIDVKLNRIKKNIKFMKNNISYLSQIKI